MFVKPNPDRTVNGKPLAVFDPVRADNLPADGRDVPPTPYWMRRLAVRDVVAAAKPAAETKADMQAEKPATPKTKKTKTKGE